MRLLSLFAVLAALVVTAPAQAADCANASDQATMTQCADGLTQARIADFKGYLSCQEGDTTCPVPAQ